MALLVMALSVAACGGKNEQASPPAQPVQTPQVAEATDEVRQFCLELDSVIRNYDAATQQAAQLATVDTKAGYQQLKMAVNTFVNEALAIRVTDVFLQDARDLWVIPIKAYRDMLVRGDLENSSDAVEINRIAIQDQLKDGQDLHKEIDEC